MPRRTSVLFFCDPDVVLSNLDGSVEVIYYHNFLELFCYICYNNTGDTNNPQFSYSPFFTLRATWSFCCNSLARSFYINKKEPDRSLTLFITIIITISPTFSGQQHHPLPSLSQAETLSQQTACSCQIPRPLQAEDRSVLCSPFY